LPSVGELASPTGDWVRSFAIVTITPNELCPQLHNRMLVVLKPENWAVWLWEERADGSALQALLAPLPSDEMTCWPVSTRVGNVFGVVSACSKFRGPCWRPGRERREK
jgi:putative SOS response-associated peptidase YedK